MDRPGSSRNRVYEEGIMKTVLAALLWLLPAASAFAGPPFRTDDPVPLEYRHGEIYLFSSGTRGGDGTSGTGPAVEFNYGPLPDMQFHIIVPMAYDAPEGDVSHFGYGDSEVGMKYRLVHETGLLPTVGIFPLVEIPTGDRDKGLGSGKTRFFFPIWLQKDLGNWTTYGGGGYWINPGSGNRNYWFTGILLQYSFSERLYLGGELFHQTADTENGEGGSGFTVGGSVPLAGELQLLFSSGRGLTDSSGNRFSYYLALYRAF
jgi:hypothetical protein